MTAGVRENKRLELKARPSSAVGLVSGTRRQVLEYVDQDLHVGCLVKEEIHSKFPPSSFFSLIRFFGKDVDTNPIIATTILDPCGSHVFNAK